MKNFLLNRNTPIYLCHNGDRNIIYMYEPFTQTIVNGFKSIDSSIVIEERYGQIDFGKIQKGSIFIFMGVFKQEQSKVPWEFLQKNNIYTIYFQTEPYSGLNFPLTFVNEIWDYGCHNIDNYDKHYDIQSSSFPDIRYIPAGVNLGKQHMIQSDICDNLIFLGCIWENRVPFKRFLDSKPILKKALITINNIWDDNSFSNLIKNSNGIFFNFHKFEGDQRRNKPVAPRISKLLNSKCLIISTRCYKKDEEEYKDMVSFCNHDEIEGEFLRLSQMKKRKDNYLLTRGMIFLKKDFVHLKYLRMLK